MKFRADSIMVRAEQLPKPNFYSELLDHGWPSGDIIFISIQQYDNLAAKYPDRAKCTTCKEPKIIIK